MVSVGEEYPVQNSAAEEHAASCQPTKLSLVVVAKAPIAGEAKTRLGASIGHAAASDLYRAFLLDTLHLFDEVATLYGEADRLIMSPNSKHAAVLRSLVRPPWTVVVQERTGLMGGIADAFDDCFGEGADPVVVADADSPSLPLQHVIDCIKLANAHDVVLGPTADGGYYLIASRRRAEPYLAELLLGTAYESSTICSATIARARQLGLTSAIGPLGMDVDTEEELRRLITTLDGHVPAGQARGLAHTREVLAKWRTDQTPPTIGLR